MAKKFDIGGALESVHKARMRFSRELDALVKRHMIENELGNLDVVCVLEDKKVRLIFGAYDIAQNDHDEDKPV